MRIEVSPFAHPSHRAQLTQLDIVPHSRALLQGENNKDCVGISLAVLLLSGKAPQKLQSAFNEIAKTRLAQFTKANEGFEFKRAGRKMFEGEPEQALRVIQKTGNGPIAKKPEPKKKDTPPSKKEASPKRKPTQKKKPAPVPEAIPA